jgi:hypothetical protein
VFIYGEDEPGPTTPRVSKVDKGPDSLRHATCGEVNINQWSSQGNVKPHVWKALQGKEAPAVWKDPYHVCDHKEGFPQK